MNTTTRRQLMAAMILTGATGAGCGTASGTQEPNPSRGTVAFTNPVVDANVPDPMIIGDDEGGWWAFATNGDGANIQTWTWPLRDRRGRRPAVDGLSRLGAGLDRLGHPRPDHVAEPGGDQCRRGPGVRADDRLPDEAARLIPTQDSLDKTSSRTLAASA